MYFVSAWVTTSTPCANASKCTPAEYVLSIATLAPCRCATSAIAGTSCTSIVMDPGLSHHRLEPRADRRRIEVARDAEAPQQRLAELTVWAVHAVGQEHVIARAGHR